MSLCVVMVWFSFFKTHNPAMQIFGSFFCAILSFGCYLGCPNFRKIKSVTVSIENECLMWVTRNTESLKNQQQSIALREIDAIEVLFVEYKMADANAVGSATCEISIVCIHGCYIRLPTDLFLGDYRKKIIAAVKRGNQVLDSIR